MKRPDRKAAPRRDETVDLLTLLGPDLPEAHCAGRWAEFDPDVAAGENAATRDTRLAHAATRYCTGCPARDRCATVGNTLRPAPLGVWGGTVRLPTPPTPGRGVEITEPTPTDTGRRTPCASSHVGDPGGYTPGGASSVPERIAGGAEVSRVA